MSQPQQTQTPSLNYISMLQHRIPHCSLCYTYGHDIGQCTDTSAIRLFHRVAIVKMTESISTFPSNNNRIIPPQTTWLNSLSISQLCVLGKFHGLNCEIPRETLIRRLTRIYIYLIYGYTMDIEPESFSSNSSNRRREEGEGVQDGGRPIIEEMSCDELVQTLADMITRHNEIYRSPINYNRSRSIHMIRWVHHLNQISNLIIGNYNMRNQRPETFTRENRQEIVEYYMYIATMVVEIIQELNQAVSGTTTTTDDSSPNEIQLQIYSSEINNENEEKNKCPICLEEYSTRQMIETNCKHMFCSNCVCICIDNMLKNNEFNCALCRSQIDSLYISDMKIMNMVQEKIFCDKKN